MDKQFRLESVKNRSVFRILLFFSFLAYLVLLTGLFKSMLAGRKEPVPLMADSAFLLPEIDGQGRFLRITGAGFNETVRASLSYDAGNQGAVVGSLKTWSHLNQVAVRGDRAFLANQHRGLQVLDVSDPKKPKIIGSVDTPGQAWGVSLDGDYAYVADGPAGLQIISIVDPEKPRLVGSIETLGNALAVDKYGELIVVVADHGGISAIDVASPENPKVLHSFALDGWGRDLAVRDGRIFLANGKNGVLVLQFDVSAGFSLLQSLKTRGEAQHVSVSENWLLVGCGKEGVEIFEFKGADLEFLTVVDTPGFARGVAAAGNRIFVADNNFGLQILECCPKGGFKNIKTVDTPCSAWGIVPANGLLFVADGAGGLKIVNDALLPESSTSRWETDGFAWGTASLGRRLYLADGLAGVKIFDVDPAGELRIVGSVDTPGCARRLEVGGDRLFVAGLAGGLIIIDARREGDVRIDAVVALPDRALAAAVAVNDDLACVAAGKAGLFVIDIADPSQPRILSQLSNLGYVRDVALAGDVAYLAAGREGLLQVSLKDPENPVLAGKVELPRHLQLFTNATVVSVAGDKLLLANSRAGCQVFDIGKPDQPRFLSSLAAMGNIIWVKGIGDRAFILDHEKELQVFDTGEPLKPRFIGSLGASNKAKSIEVVDGKAYLALGGGGVSRIPLPVEVRNMVVANSSELTLRLPPLPATGNYLLTLFKDDEYTVLDEPITLQAEGQK